MIVQNKTKKPESEIKREIIRNTSKKPFCDETVRIS